MKRRKEITVETTEVLIVRKSGGATLLWCAECSRRVSMLTPDQAMAVAGVSARAVYRLVESGRVHYRETPDGFIFICADSLA